MTKGTWNDEPTPNDEGTRDPTVKIDFSAVVRAKVRRIPYGHVLTYGDVAALVGHPRAARGVGAALRGLGEQSDVPWWRVVNARGEISLGSFPGRLQRMMLEQEGVRFERGERVDLRKYRWTTAPGSSPREAEDGR